MFGGVVRCVDDGGVSYWLAIYVDLYFGGVFENRQVKEVDSVIVFVCGCEFQGGVYAVNVVQDCFWRYFLGVVYYQYVVDISCVEDSYSYFIFI
jgi:hypothetical protein